MHAPQIGQIYCSNNLGFVSSLAAVVSTVKGCTARVDTSWPVEANCKAWNDVFLVISCIDPSDPNELDRQVELVQASRHSSRFPEFIFLGENLSFEHQAKILRAGATEILEAPFDLRRLRYLVESRMLTHRHLAKHNAAVANSVTAPSKLDRKISKIADLDTNILLSGETGVGKTFVAEQIHKTSRRSKHPFVVVDCSTIPANLVESELFGHAKGAFTDAVTTRIGQFEHVGAGTILLDEIDCLTPAVQAKLLRVVEKREFRRVGENRPLPLKARIISATNLDLDDLVQESRFRADLFFRLNAYEIRIPRLSKRQDEIENLAHLFADEFARENNQTRKAFCPKVLQLFRHYNWPGNLRELRNCVFHGGIDADDSIIRLENLPERMIVFATTSDAVGLFDAQPQVAESTSHASPVDTELYSEAKRLVLALENNRYNRSRAARELGVSRMTIYNMMKRHHFG